MTFRSSLWAAGFTLLACATPGFAGTVVQLSMDGSSGSTVFADDTALQTVTAFGDAQISTAESRFGGAGGFFDGVNDYLDVSSGADFDLGTGDFTVETWARPTLLSGSQAIFDIRDSHGDYGEFYLRNGEIALSNGSLGTVTGTTTLIADNWYHLAWTRDSGVLRMFVNGAQEGGNIAMGGQVGGAGYEVTVGKFRTTSGGEGEYYRGYLDELRVIKGEAVYTAGFAPPTAPFTVPEPASGALLFLLLGATGLAARKSGTRDA